MISSFVGRLFLFVGLGACITYLTKKEWTTQRAQEGTLLPRFRISMVEKRQQKQS
jgi:hypothetical protein